MQYLHFFIAYRVGIKGDWRLHCDKGEQLQHVVLYHVADGSRFLVVGGAPLNANVFGHGNLDVVYITPIPDWLENAIGKAENQDVLYGFFAQIVIYTIDLFFSKDLPDLAI